LITTPENENDLENKKEDRKLNLSLHKKSELRSIIDPPSEKPRAHGKGRGDRSQNEKVETGDLEGRIFKDKMEKDKEGGGHQKGNRKMDDHGMWMASCHWKLLEKILKYRRKVFQFLRCSFFQNPHLWISFKDFCSMRSRRDLSSKILA
jgi:hypothetical protein